METGTLVNRREVVWFKIRVWMLGFDIRDGFVCHVSCVCVALVQFSSDESLWKK